MWLVVSKIELLSMAIWPSICVKKEQLCLSMFGEEPRKLFTIKLSTELIGIVIKPINSVESFIVKSFLGSSPNMLKHSCSFFTHIDGHFAIDSNSILLTTSHI